MTSTPLPRIRVRRSALSTIAATEPAVVGSGRLQIVYRSPSELKPARALRKHEKRQREHLERNLRCFGCVCPILIERDGTIVDGSAVAAAAKAIGLAEIPTVTLDGLSEIEIRALRISLNKIQEMSSWDENQLKVELIELAEIDIEILTFTAFSTQEIDIILNPPPGEDEEDPDDEVSVSAGPAVSELGDLWIFKGGHRLACGSALDPQLYTLLMGNSRARLVFSDPPFNLKIAGNVSRRPGVREFAAASGEMSPAEFTEFLRQAFELGAQHALDGSMHLHFMDWRHVEEMMAAGRSAYTELKNVIVWAKSNAGMGSLWRSQHELVFAWKHGAASHVNNVDLGRHGRWRSNVWSYGSSNAFGRHRDSDLAGHVTPKNVAMIQDAILDVTHPGDVVLDNFAGAGTTLVAAHRAKRIGFGSDIDPLYVDTAVCRLEELVGEPARHAGTGKTFAETAALRRQALSPTTNAA